MFRLLPPVWEQLALEAAATGEVATLDDAGDAGESSGASWGIISVKPQDVAHELPMQPITIMRK